MTRVASGRGKIIDGVEARPAGDNAKSESTASWVSGPMSRVPVAGEEEFEWVFFAASARPLVAF
jgi:hypothetical protein